MRARSNTSLGFALCCLLGWLLSTSAMADAIVRTQAMFATTIAEIYVDADVVRLELEIGLKDLEAFRSLLPDDMHAEMGFGDMPVRQRIERFLNEEFRVLADGEQLDGVLLRIGPDQRVRRDEITGEELPAGETPEIVINASFVWPLSTQPQTIEFGLALPGSASVGFVAYHENIAVNDFRYMTASQVLQLDWQDPWYTAFETRALRRQYYAAMTGFIYVEPYEVRKEIIIRPKDVQRYVDLGLAERDTIPVEMQADIRKKVIDFLSQHQPVTIDGKPVEPAAVRADFLERTLRTSRVIDPPEELDVNAAIMGVKFIYPHPSFPDNATMRWDLWDERTQMVPVSAVDPTGPLPQFLEPDYDLLEWQNFIRIPVMPQLAEVSRPPGTFALALVYGRYALVLLAALLMLWFIRSALRPTNSLRTVGIVTGVGLSLAYATWWAGGEVRVNNDSARGVVTGVLTNVYRAFDFREEGDIYDVLEQSVDGDLLREVYLEMRRGLVLASQGGASARVKEVELIDLQTEPTETNGFQAQATWQVRAAVGHWGHIHERRNEYRANLQLQPIDGAWKLVNVEILDEVRL
jgi:hypothetical protein